MAQPDPTPDTHRVMHFDDPDLIRLRSEVAKVGPALSRANERYGALKRDYDALVEMIGEMQGTLEARIQSVRGLAGKALQAAQTVAGVTETPIPKSHADLIIEFLDAHAPLKMNPTSIAENLGLSPGNVAERCTLLAGERKIQKHQQAGRNPLYSSKKKVQP